MAAESPRQSLKAPGAVSRPQPVSDKSIMESVVDFIHDVVPQSYGGSSKSDERDVITWVKFAYADINDLSGTLGDDRHHNENTTPLLLILGYSSGVQIWVIPANGEAQEVLSWRHNGAVRALCVLPTPVPSYNTQDIFYGRRPLVAICDSSSAGQQFCSVSFVSLRTGDQVDCIKFKNPVCNIHCNKRVVVISFQERIAVFDACTFKDKFTISSCYPSVGPNLNPIALGTNWLAYADQKLVSVHQTAGGVAGSGVQSYTATVIHAAKTLTKGLTMFGETVASSLTGNKSVQTPTRKDHLASDSSQPQPGIVTIVDIKNVGHGEVNVHEDSDGDGIIAHFVAHANESVAAMQFDFSGILLLSTDRLGHNFHLFRILPHPMSSSLGAVHHLYTLYRGDTTAKVQDIAFSLDSRWVAVSTLRGTTHIFPITSYGGPVTLRTHATPKVVNRLSRFHKSAGLEDIQPSNTGRNSPVLSSSPGLASATQPVKGSSQGNQSGRAYDTHPSVPYSSIITGRMGNPRLPPYPNPTVVSPLAQIRQLTPFAGFTCAGGARSPPTKNSKVNSAVVANRAATETVNVAVVFAHPRSWLVGSPGGINKDKIDKRCVDSLYVIGCNGTVIEYALEPHVSSNAAKSNEDSSVELGVQPQAQWHLNRTNSSSEVKPPLSSTNALIVAQEFIMALRNERSPGLSRPPMSIRRDGGGSLGDSSSGSESDDSDERWLSQVEIITHAGPHRRLWMGPQFSFKTFQHSANTTILSATSSALLCQSPENSTVVSSQGMDILMEEQYLESLGARPTRSTPVAMPGGRHRIPLLIEAGSAGSFEQSPGMFENSWPDGCSNVSEHCVERPTEDQLKENLAEAMIESPARVNVAGVNCISHNVNSSEFQGSSEELSTSSSQSGSTSNTSDSRISPPQTGEHLLVFPGNTTPPTGPSRRKLIKS